MIHYTVGQRKGLGIAFGRPMYVLAKNAQENTVMLGPDEALFSREMLVERLNFISIEALSAPLQAAVFYEDDVVVGGGTIAAASR